MLWLVVVVWTPASTLAGSTRRSSCFGEQASMAEAARALADRFGCSVRQARRYVERAVEQGSVVVPEETTVFTVRLPSMLVARARERARESGSTISALVTTALTEFLARGHRKGLRE